jgi:fluoroquinolone transport system permease protein
MKSEIRKNLWWILLGNEVENIRRDPLLRWLVILPAALIPLVRYGLPALAAALLTHFNFDLQPYFVLILSGLTLLPAILTSMVVGFLLLDERDEGSLLALQVTPLTLPNYLFYKCSWPLVAGTAVNLLLLPAVGLIPLTWPQIALVSLVTAPLAPLLALVLVLIAQNKVQGFAVAKGLSGIPIFLISAYFVPMPYQLLAGVIPSFWAVKLFWVLAENGSGAWVYALVGLVYQLLLIWWLTGRVASAVLRQ